MKFLWLPGISALLAVSLAAQTTGPSSSLPAVKGEPTVPALMLAVQSGDAAAVDQLLKRGADPNQTDAAGATALMWAIPDIEKVRRLVAAGANVNARSTDTGRTPLLIAANYPGTVELLKLLLARGADLRAKDAAGFTALGLAMLSADVEVVRFLVENGSRPERREPGRGAALGLRAAASGSRRVPDVARPESVRGRAHRQLAAARSDRALD